MLDFGLLPPEVNSGRMYSGPGPGPLLAAAEAWDSLASDLGIASAGYGSTLSELTSGSWTGPTSSAMMAAVTPYVDWLSTTAAQAEQTANQARAAVAAYEAAFAMTVPPPAIAANRALLLALVATNFFGQNTAAIMATEALYVEMWAQDAAAMYSYPAASAAAAVVTPFVAPPQTANQDGVNNQADAVAKAAADTGQPSRDGGPKRRRGGTDHLRADDHRHKHGRLDRDGDSHIRRDVRSTNDIRPVDSNADPQHHRPVPDRRLGPGPGARQP